LKQNLENLKIKNQEMMKETEENREAVRNVWPHFIKLMVSQCNKIMKLKKKYENLLNNCNKNLN